jgi:hypothetical protein
MAQTRSIALAAAALLVAGCTSSSPTSPNPPAPVDTTPLKTIHAGTWTGVFSIASCTGPAQACSRDPEPFTLRMGADGRGVLQVEVPFWYDAPAIAVDVAAGASTESITIEGRSALTMSGSRAYTFDARVTLTEMGTTLAGTLRYTLTTEYGTAIKEGAVLFATYDATARPSRFDGTWTGFATVTACSGNDCPAVGTALPLRIVLSQVGASVKGRFEYLDVSGTATGDQLTLSGHWEISAEACSHNFDGATCLQNLELSATVDALDRLHGTYTYRHVYDDGRVYTATTAANLAGVVRWP